MSRPLRKENFKDCLLRSLFYDGMLSLAELSERCHKSIPNVTSAVGELLRDGYVTEHKLAASTGGRRPTKFSLNVEKGLVIVAVAMDQLVTRVSIQDLASRNLTGVHTLNLNVYQDERALDKFISFVQSVIAASEIPADRILGVGIAMPGFINVEEGINYSFFTETEENLSDYLCKKFALPVYIDNDSSAIALAELRVGSAKGLDNVMVVNFGWGIGLGMIVNGNLFRGHTGYAGEFSHIPLSTNDDL